MRLIADESCDFAIVRGLRAAGHDVSSVTESCAGSSDEQVIELAQTQRRLLITEDKDFGQLVFAAAKENSGVILIRYPALTRATLIASLATLLTDQAETLYRAFVVMEPGRVRLNRWA